MLENKTESKIERKTILKGSKLSKIFVLYRKSNAFQNQSKSREMCFCPEIVTKSFPKAGNVFRGS